MRKATIERNTRETQITLSLNLDGNGKSDVKSGSGFFDHMLELVASHSLCDIELRCRGDVEVDYHHTVEDIGICFGKALKEALGDKAGLQRYGDIILPMDETLTVAAIDISGRSYLHYDVCPETEKVGDFDTELVEEFFLAFVREAAVTLHLIELYGSNTHHILEGTFKAFARALKEAVALDDRLDGRIPSSKGSIE